ncbi:hypothetical protein [Chachezhania antarctica]|uniref:hypothetical protein n=1 Tax=Chachezhania antarctica TaxID=2340860 RepID=UPI000EAFE8E2|nr:hypothetical protein [Chachezhania antarctica]|tara:strand:+ start:695 stop:1438 length:744 start_codon:yes stop_codon:yes gene_type:complete
MDITDTVYPGGFYSLMRFLEEKEVPYDDPLAVLPPVDVDLAGLTQISVIADTTPLGPYEAQDARRKYATLTAEFDGESELLLVHAICVAVLRRRAPPAEALSLFHRMWHEQGQYLADALPVRWLVSAAVTFAAHGETPAQLSGGMGLAMLFDLIKLHDSERSLTGRPNDRAFPRRSGRKRHPLAFDLAPYALVHGDMDRIILARLWRFAEEDAVLRPLGFRLLRLLMEDRRTVFARVQRYKKRKDDD